MSIFAISDLHLSFGVNKPMDIFRGWSDYVDRIEKNWMSTVSKDDTVVIAGDISWGMNFDEALADLVFLNNLPGKKIILKGNHDYWWNTMSKMEAFFSENGLDSISILFNNAYRIDETIICGSRGWINDTSVQHNQKIVLRECGRLESSIKAGIKLRNNDEDILVFLHYPPVTKVASCNEIIDVLKRNDIKKCFYGHIHGDVSQYAFNGKMDGIDYTITSCDALGFNPMKIL